LLLWKITAEKIKVQDTKIPEDFYMISLIPIRLMF